VWQKVHTAATYNAARIRHQVTKAQQSSDQHFKAEPKVHAETTCSNTPAPRQKSVLLAAAATAASTKYGLVRNTYSVAQPPCAATGGRKVLHSAGDHDCATNAWAAEGGVRGRVHDFLPKCTKKQYRDTKGNKIENRQPDL
jgi:hypothetical protein